MQTNLFNFQNPLYTDANYRVDIKSSVDTAYERMTECNFCYCNYQTMLHCNGNKSTSINQRTVTDVKCAYSYCGQCFTTIEECLGCRVTFIDGDQKAYSNVSLLDARTRGLVNEGITVTCTSEVDPSPKEPETRTLGLADEYMRKNRQFQPSEEPLVLTHKTVIAEKREHDKNSHGMEGSSTGIELTSEQLEIVKKYSDSSISDIFEENRMLRRNIMQCLFSCSADQLKAFSHALSIDDYIVNSSSEEKMISIIIHQSSIYLKKLGTFFDFFKDKPVARKCLLNLEPVKQINDQAMAALDGAITREDKKYLDKDGECIDILGDLLQYNSSSHKYYLAYFMSMPGGEITKSTESLSYLFHLCTRSGIKKKHLVEACFDLDLDNMANRIIRIYSGIRQSEEYLQKPDHLQKTWLKQYRKSYISDILIQNRMLRRNIMKCLSHCPPKDLVELTYFLNPSYDRVKTDKGMIFNIIKHLDSQRRKFSLLFDFFKDKEYSQYFLADETPLKTVNDEVMPALAKQITRKNANSSDVIRVFSALNVCKNDLYNHKYIAMFMSVMLSGEYSSFVILINSCEDYGKIRMKFVEACLDLDLEVLAKAIIEFYSGETAQICTKEMGAPEVSSSISNPKKPRKHLGQSKEDFRKNEGFQQTSGKIMKEIKSNPIEPTKSSPIFTPCNDEKPSTSNQAIAMQKIPVSGRDSYAQLYQLIKGMEIGERSNYIKGVTDIEIDDKELLSDITAVAEIIFPVIYSKRVGQQEEELMNRFMLDPHNISSKSNQQGISAQPLTKNKNSYSQGNTTVVDSKKSDQGSLKPTLEETKISKEKIESIKNIKIKPSFYKDNYKLRKWIETEIYNKISFGGIKEFSRLVGVHDIHLRSKEENHVGNYINIALDVFQAYFKRYGTDYGVSNIKWIMQHIDIFKDRQNIETISDGKSLDIEQVDGVLDKNEANKLIKKHIALFPLTRNFTPDLNAQIHGYFDLDSSNLYTLNKQDGSIVYLHHLIDCNNADKVIRYLSGHYIAGYDEFRKFKEACQ
nr:hypothetical protein [Endozoicomonas sp.]